MGQGHPIARFARGLDAALDKLVAANPVFMSRDEKAEALVLLEQGRDRLAALEMRLLVVSGEVTEDGAYRTVADFVSAQTHADRGPLAAAERLGRELDERWRVLGEAAAAGAVSIDKVRVIAAALGELAGDPTVSGEVLAKAELHLISIAPDFTAKQLKVLARRVLEFVAPEIGQAAEARALEADERRAREAMRFSFRAAPDGLLGVTEIHGRVPDAVATRLKTYLEAFTNPRVSALVEQADAAVARPERAHSRRMAEAFCSLVETLDPNRLPIHGGAATTVMVTIALSDLRRDLAGADLAGCSDDASRISAGEARRLACTGEVIPMVLGGKSEVLDLGRASRLFSPAQRKAMAVRDRRCRADGCTQPANWCEAHHFKQPWSQGGRTDLRDGKLLCRWHHQRAHDSRYETSEMANGDVRFTRRR